MPILGLILGITGKKQSMDYGAPTGKAQAGIITSIIGLTIAILIIILVIVLLTGNLGTTRDQWYDPYYYY